MNKPANHVVPSKAIGWAVKKSGASRASRNFSTKSEAVEYARRLSKEEHTTMYVHKKNGMIQTRNSY